MTILFNCWHDLCIIVAHEVYRRALLQLTRTVHQVHSTLGLFLLHVYFNNCTICISLILDILKNKAIKNDVYEKWNKSVHVYQDRLKILTNSNGVKTANVHDLGAVKKISTYPVCHAYKTFTWFFTPAYPTYRHVHTVNEFKNFLFFY